MAVLETQHPTLLDLAKRLDPDDRIADIVEILNETNPILDDMVFMEGNLLTGHRTTVRTGLPQPTWRKLYGGVQPTKSTTAQVTDNTGMLEAYAEVDKELADLNGNTAAWRLSEDRAHIEGMSQELAETIFYGNEGTEPEAFTGLAPRFNDLSAQNGENIIDAGGTGNQLRSIWLVGWGERSVHGIVPKGSTAGLTTEDKGQVTIEDVDGNGGRMEAYRTHYKMKAGLTVRDWRYIVRIANIDPTALEAHPDPLTDVFLPDLMFEALERIEGLEGVRPVFYMPRTILTKVRQQSTNATKNSTLMIENVGGKQIATFNGISMKRTDALAVDEAEVQ